MDLRRLAILAGGCISFLAVLAGSYLLTTAVALQGLYVTVACFAAVLFLSVRTSVEPPLSRGRNIRLALIICCLIIASSSLGYRHLTFPLLGLGVAVIGVAILGGGVPVFETSILAGATAASRYLATGLYFGSGDLLRNFHRVERLAKTNSVEGIGGLYSSFPGLFIDVYTLTGVTNLQIITAGSILAFVLGLSLILIAFIFGREFDSEIGVWILPIALAFPLYSWSLSEWHTRQLGTALLLMLIWVALYRQQRAFRLVGFVFVAALVISHHVSIVLSVVVLAPAAVMAWITDMEGRSAWIKFPLVSGVIVVSYWVFVGVGFVQAAILTAFAQTTAGVGFFFSLDFENPGLLRLGEPVQEMVILQADPYLQLGHAALLAPFLIGLGTVYRRRVSDATGGGIGAAAFFHSPLQYRLLPRIALLASPFLLQVIATGVETIRQRSGVAAILLLVVIGASGPLLAADDLGLWNRQPSAFSDGEMEQLNAISTFQSEDRDVQSFWATERVLEYVFDQPVHGEFRLRDGGVQSDTPFVVRHRWRSHRVTVEREGVYLRNVQFGQGGVDELTADTSKIYSSGGFSVIIDTHE